MPLFQFAYHEEALYAFGCCPLTIERFSSGEIPDIPLFSRQDVEAMTLERWCLVWNDSATSNYKTVANLALLAFRLCAKEEHATPFIKYRLCQERPELSACLEEAMTTNWAVTDRLHLYDGTWRALPRRERSCRTC